MTRIPLLLSGYACYNIHVLFLLEILVSIEFLCLLSSRILLQFLVVSNIKFDQQLIGYLCVLESDWVSEYLTSTHNSND